MLVCAFEIKTERKFKVFKALVDVENLYCFITFPMYIAEKEYNYKRYKVYMYFWNLKDFVYVFDKIKDTKSCLFIPSSLIYKYKVLIEAYYKIVKNRESEMHFHIFDKDHRLNISLTIMFLDKGDRKINAMILSLNEKGFMTSVVIRCKESNLKSLKDLKKFSNFIEFFAYISEKIRESDIYYYYGAKSKHEVIMKIKDFIHKIS